MSHVKKMLSARANARYARAVWGDLPKAALLGLGELSRRYGVSVAAGDLQLLDGRWYITNSGLVGIANRRRCTAITTRIDRLASDPSNNRWVFKAVVYKCTGSKGFAAYGDADPSNCSSLVHGAELRVAETRAVNRALRKAYGIGLCSVEELGDFAKAPNCSTDRQGSTKAQPKNPSQNGQPRLRDQLCVLIRQYNLDPILVKAYAADFCGSETLSNASRNSIESFISHLSTAAKENRDGLVCKLNSYVQPAVAKP